jgi:hypothetical protein
MTNDDAMLVRGERSMRRGEMLFCASSVGYTQPAAPFASAWGGRVNRTNPYVEVAEAGEGVGSPFQETLMSVFGLCCALAQRLFPVDSGATKCHR